MIRIGKFRWP